MFFFILSPLFIPSILAEFWHDDVRLVRGQNKVINRNDIHNLVSIWKTMASSSPSALPIGDTNEEINSNTEKQISLKQRNKSQIILARKLRNLQEFANAYNLNLSNPDDTLLKTASSRENVQRMAKDLLASIDETNQMNLDSFVTQFPGRLLTRSRLQTFYQELIDVMPPKWKEIFQEQQSI